MFRGVSGDRVFDWFGCQLQRGGGERRRRCQPDAAGAVVRRAECYRRRFDVQRQPRPQLLRHLQQARDHHQGHALRGTGIADSVSRSRHSIFNRLLTPTQWSRDWLRGKARLESSSMMGMVCDCATADNGQRPLDFDIDVVLCPVFRPAAKALRQHGQAVSGPIQRGRTGRAEPLQHLQPHRLRPARAPKVD